MLNKIIDFSLKNKLAVIVMSILIAVLGSWAALQMPIDVFPDLNKPQVVIMTEAHAMSAEDVENLVTRPIEQTLNGATNVSSVRSQSSLGLSVVTVQFDWGTDVYRNRQVVQEKLPMIMDRLPNGINPTMMPISSIMGQIQMIAFSSKTGKTSAEDIRALVDNELKYRLVAIPGVSKISVVGGSPKQLQIVANPDKLRTFSVGLEDIKEAVMNRNLNGSGGFLSIGAKAPVITVTGLIDKAEDLSKAVIHDDEDRAITIGDVADVQFGPAAIKVGEAGFNGRRAVLLTVLKQNETDTVKLTNAIDEALAEMQLTLDEDIEIESSVFKQSDFIDRAIDNVIEAIRDGGFMVVVVLLLFLMNWRISVITLMAIPLSIAVTALIFQAAGYSINTMTLGGLSVAIGALVDDAIVDVENIFRRLKENFAKPEAEREEVSKIIYDASCEVRKPIVIGTLLVIVVYLPLFFLIGLEGKLFSPIGLTYIISILASLLVALTLTPVMSYYLLPASFKTEKSSQDTWLVRVMKVQAEKVIRFSVKFRMFIFVAFAALFIGSIFLLTKLGTQFLPEFNEGSVQVNLTLPPDTSLTTSDKYGKLMEDELMKVEGVSFVGRRSGRAEGDEHAEGVNRSEAIVSIDPASERTREEVLSEIRERLNEKVPGAAITADQPLAHLISHMLSGVTAQVSIKIFGTDLKEMRKIAENIEAEAEQIDGVTDLTIGQQMLTPRIIVKPVNDNLKRFGVTVRQLAETVELGLEGAAIDKMIDGQYSYGIVLRLDEQSRNDMEDIRDLYIHKENGDMVRVRDVANVQMASSYNMVKHENGSRVLAVSHNIQGRSLGEVVEELKVKIDEIRRELPQGYSIKIGGQYEAQQNASQRIIWLSIASVFLMFIILYGHFKSISLSVQLMLGIPLAFIGAALYVYISGQTISIATLVGFIALGGVAARNGILLIDHYIHLIKEEKKEFTIETLVLAGQQRLVPVLMTALTSGIALIPIALAPGAPGKEILYPVATVIIGGLISSTILDFMFTPALFWIFGKKALEVE